MIVTLETDKGRYYGAVRAASQWLAEVQPSRVHTVKLDGRNWEGGGYDLRSRPSGKFQARTVEARMVRHAAASKNDGSIASWTAFYAFALGAAQACEDWEARTGKRHPWNPGPGGGLDTISPPPAYLARYVERTIIAPMRERYGHGSTDDDLAARWPDYRHGADVKAFAYNLANALTGDGGANWGDGRPEVRGSLDLWLSATAKGVRIDNGASFRKPAGKVQP